MGFLRDFGGVDTPHSVSTPEKKAFDKKNPCKWTLRRLERVFSVRRYFPSESIQGQKIKMARNRNRKKREERRRREKENRARKRKGATSLSVWTCLSAKADSFHFRFRICFFSSSYSLLSLSKRKKKRNVCPRAPLAALGFNLITSQVIPSKIWEVWGLMLACSGAD